MGTDYHLRSSWGQKMSEYDPKPSGKPILCLDFDGVIHSYTSGWKGADVIPDPPVPGVFEFIDKALQYFDIHIYSSRSLEAKGRVAMYEYMCRHSSSILIDGLHFASKKPRAFLTIDDRCLLFQGDWSVFDPRSLLEFQPWYRSQK